MHVAPSSEVAVGVNEPVIRHVNALNDALKTAGEAELLPELRLQIGKQKLDSRIFYRLINSSYWTCILTKNLLPSYFKSLNCKKNE